MFVELTGSGAETRARIRIVEVKDYPNRSVPLEEFTAIRGSGLRANLEILERDAAAARRAIARGEPLPDSFAGLGLDVDQINAIARTMERRTGIAVEVMVGPTTRIGAEGHHASSVLPDLRREIEATLGPGSFRTNAEGRATTISQAYVDQATSAAMTARGRTGAGP